MDGDKVGETTTRQMWTSIARRTTRIIAIQCTDTNTDKWIWEEFAEPFHPKTWACTERVASSEWPAIEFDDSSWQEVNTFEKVDNRRKIRIHQESQTTFYCRGKIGMSYYNLYVQ